ncbi:MAG: T9SS type A sorting domain-containing protein, partial [Ichthyobacteriaceae bacterium]|nr:T9SS type A sorting domain-containing protein [Ichthyobacteriaceae bacterium]
KSLEVYSINGMLVYSANDLSSETSIDASAWKAGVYLVVVNTENERKVSKIIKK